MDLVSALNPPRLIHLGGTEYWCRQLMLEDIAILLAWLDDVLPGKSERSMPPKLTSEESWDALDTSHGLCVLAWVGLRHSGVGFPEASEAIMSSSHDERVRLASVLFGRRRTMKLDGEPGKELSQSWWGPSLCGLMEHYRLSIDDIRRLSIDQLDCLANEGLPLEEPGRLSVSDVQAMWEMARSSSDGTKARDN